MSEDKLMTTPNFTKKQLDILTRITPEKYIKSRQGRGGQSFSYVEVGYVVSTLNEAFGPAWDWEIIEQGLGKKKVWVKGRLTVWFGPDFKFSKVAFGGTDVKYPVKYVNNARVTDYEAGPIDVGDDLKAASADALKKAASMFGLAADIYFPQMDRLDFIGDEEASAETESLKREAEIS